MTDLPSDPMMVLRRWPRVAAALTEFTRTVLKEPSLWPEIALVAVNVGCETFCYWLLQENRRLAVQIARSQWQALDRLQRVALRCELEEFLEE